MERYLMYLRKSRMDTDFDEVSVEETLNRHRRILESFCKERRLNVVEVLEEVVSGESLSSRPKMLRLLELVNTGMYAGVICIDIERLSRGSSLESGYIMQVLQTNNCKIITPSKIYDLQNESDEQFTDMKFMFSRYELKTITKRLVRGRNQSASEGKFLGSVAPYGYRIYKLAGVKGNSLKIESSEAKIVQMIFDMYGKQGIGYNTIAYQLNEMHIPSQTGTWGQTSITNILNNEVYLGMIRWKHEPTKRIVKDGMLAKKRVVSKDYELYEGLHEPIISQEQWDMVKSKQQERNHSSVNSNRQLTNPFATILFCEKCGAVMKRNVPSKKQKTSPWYRCPTRGCDCRAIKCDFAEESILKAMKEWLAEYTVNIETEKTIQVDPVETALKVVREQLAETQLQQDKICEYLEKGVYTVEMFTKRNDTLTREMRKLQASEADLLKKQSSQSDIKNAEAEIIPTTQRILDSYSRLSVPEKNSLWKIVMEKITMYRTPDGEFSMHIYPKLPMKNGIMSHSLFQYGISTIASFCGIIQYYAITKGGAFYGRTEA
jgi:site-specific DNA recombinase